MKCIKLTTACFLGVALLLASCSKNDDPIMPRRWVKTYNSITIGDDENTAEGQFLNTRTGAVVKLRNSAAVRSQLSLLYSVTYAGWAYLTAPANLDAEDPYNANQGPIYNAPGLGILEWKSSEMNSIEVYLCNMTSSAFDQLSNSNSWQAFDNAFRSNNGGDADLSAPNSASSLSVGEVYLMQINGSLRCIVQVLSVSNSQTNGFITLKMVIEGREDMGSSGKALMPAE